MMDAAAADEPTCIEGYRRAGGALPPGPMENIPPIARSRTASADLDRCIRPSTLIWRKPRASSSIRNR